MPEGFVTRDSGKRQEFKTGSRRDTNAGKPRFDLLPIPALRRWADLMARGAEKYGARNWERGQPMSRFGESALRHLYQYLEGDRDEDHLAAVLFNIGALIHHEVEIEAGRLPAELDDRPKPASAPRVAMPTRHCWCKEENKEECCTCDLKFREGCAQVRYGNDDENPGYHCEKFA